MATIVEEETPGVTLGSLYPLLRLVCSLGELNERPQENLLAPQSYVCEETITVINYTN